MYDFSSYGDPSAEWLAIESTLPAAPVGQSLSETKRAANLVRERLAAAEIEPLLPQLRIRDHAIQTRDGEVIEARSYEAPEVSQRPLPAYLHLHGGGFFFGSLSSEDAICARMALEAGVVVVNVNYRHSPEWTYPTAWNDAEDAWAWLVENHEHLGIDTHCIVLGGISAGAWLTASMVQQWRRGKLQRILPAPAGQVLMIPCLVLDGCNEVQIQQLTDPSVYSMRTLEKAPILGRAQIDFFNGLLQFKDPAKDDLRLNPGNASAEDVAGLPPTTLGICGLDPLRDDGLLYGKLLANAG